MDDRTGYQCQGSAGSQQSHSGLDVCLPGSRFGQGRLHGLERLGHVYVHINVIPHRPGALQDACPRVFMRAFYSHFARRNAVKLVPMSTPWIEMVSPVLKSSKWIASTPS